MSNFTPSEARAEAATFVLQLILRRLFRRRQRRRLYLEARSMARDFGNIDVEDEVAWLFNDVDEARRDMLGRDGCGPV